MHSARHETSNCPFTWIHRCDGYRNNNSISPPHPSTSPLFNINKAFNAFVSPVLRSRVPPSRSPLLSSPTSLNAQRSTGSPNVQPGGVWRRRRGRVREEEGGAEERKGKENDRREEWERWGEVHAGCWKAEHQKWIRVNLFKMCRDRLSCLVFFI